MRDSHITWPVRSLNSLKKFHFFLFVLVKSKRLLKINFNFLSVWVFGDQSVWWYSNTRITLNETKLVMMPKFLRFQTKEQFRILGFYLQNFRLKNAELENPNLYLWAALIHFKVFNELAFGSHVNNKLHQKYLCQVSSF